MQVRWCRATWRIGTRRGAEREAEKRNDDVTVTMTDAVTVTGTVTVTVAVTVTVTVAVTVTVTVAVTVTGSQCRPVVADE